MELNIALHLIILLERYEWLTLERAIYVGMVYTKMTVKFYRSLREYLPSFGPHLFLKGGGVNFDYLPRMGGSEKLKKGG